MDAINISLILFCVAINAAAQALIRSAMISIDLSTKNMGVFCSQFFGCLFTPQIIGALTIYVISVLTWMYVLSRVEVSIAYPMMSLSFVATVFLGWYFFDEALTWQKGLGVALICAGVYVLALAKGTA